MPNKNTTLLHNHTTASTESDLVETTTESDLYETTTMDSDLYETKTMDSELFDTTRAAINF